MSRQASATSSDEHSDSTDDLTFTRRTALALLGAGGFGAAAEGAAAQSGNGSQAGGTGGNGGGGRDARPWNQDVDARDHDLRNLGAVDVDRVYTTARDADVIVWKDDEGVFHADGRDDQVASGEDVLDVTQAAVDSLTDDRTWKEKVAVVSPGTVPYNDGDFREIELPSYTVLDVAAPISCEYEAGEHSNVIVAAARDAEHIEIPRLTVKGGPWMAVRFQRCSNVRLGEIEIQYEEDSDANDGVRIDNGYDIGTPQRCEDVQIDSVYLENGTKHGVETYGVNRLQIDRVIGKDMDGCAVLLNQTSDATVNSVVGRNPGGEEDYPTFRLANFCNNVSIGQVVSRGGAKGLMFITARNATVGEVNLVGAEDKGIFLTASYNVRIDGGVIKNCENEAIRIHGYASGTFSYDVPTEGVSVTDVRILDDRPEDERSQPYGIYESGPTAFSNQFVDNDVRGAGTEADIRVKSGSTVVADNVGDGVASGSVSLSPGESPAARVEGISGERGATLDLRDSVVEAPDAAFALEHHFEWNPDGESWDLVFEWVTDPGESVELEYIVDRPQANLGGREVENTWNEFAGME
ncbi:right-handed parallel beta-helix repeat-containing protein [Halopiger aswanensis]|uniref:Parallel beta helix pectate lyase-like protein n=1 Tax=Halopiger aswanensis TaxID=148449 RepID=A0A3R7HG44_9EURY|nr:right-handed parallel beta-helix repeat-containing protein [Halopiger aswanensis]RKD88878.1 hypothetical protein ATJ93_3691 [Halopiger aswanensis]